jgi:glutathione synthase/RimK-type ligase-like ATP-grasp enzyme
MVAIELFLGESSLSHTRDLLKAYKLRFSQKWLRKKTYRVMTTRIDSSHLKQIDTIRTAPCLFQEYIDKKFELRIIVIGDEIFTAEIHSQAHDKTSDDWRDYSVQIPYYKGDLPLTLKEKIHQFVKSYGLNFSALDFILTPDGRYVFLENNPNGQFLWLQSLIPELRLKEAMASCLIKGKFQAG